MASKKQIGELKAAREHGIGRLLLMARRDFMYRLAQRMQDAGLELLPRSSGALLPFIDLEGTRSVDLARRMGITKQGVTKLVKELIERGLLRRQDDDSDGRAFRVVFTEGGLDYLLSMHKAIRKVEKEYEALVGKDDMRITHRVLNLIVYGDD
jgi:DNA-binding MarR family transcriptional regulator